MLVGSSVDFIIGTLASSDGILDSGASEWRNSSIDFHASSKEPHSVDLELFNAKSDKKHQIESPEHVEFVSENMALFSVNLKPIIDGNSSATYKLQK